MLALVQNSIVSIWKGEAINDIKNPLNIEDLWSDADLLAIGLHRVVNFVVPNGMQIVSGSVPSYALNLDDNKVYETFKTEAIPVDPRTSSFDIDSAVGALKTKLATSTNTDIDNYFTANITNASQAIALLKALVKVLAQRD